MERGVYRAGRNVHEGLARRGIDVAAVKLAQSSAGKNCMEGDIAGVVDPSRDVTERIQREIFSTTKHAIISGHLPLMVERPVGSLTRASERGGSTVTFSRSRARPRWPWHALRDKERRELAKIRPWRLYGASWRHRQIRVPLPGSSDTPQAPQTFPLHSKVSGSKEKK